MDDVTMVELRRKCLNDLYSCVDDIVKYLNDSKEIETEFDRLRNSVKEYCKLELLEKRSTQALEIIENEAEVIELVSLEARYQELSQLTQSDNKFERHPYVIELEKHIKEAKRANKRRFEEEENVDENEEVTVVGVSNAYIDPLGQKRIINPMKNRICKHVYEKDTIEKYIAHKNNKGCPYVRCPNTGPMKLQDLFLDMELKNTLDTSAATSSNSLSQSSTISSQ